MLADFLSISCNSISMEDIFHHYWLSILTGKQYRQLNLNKLHSNQDILFYKYCSDSQSNIHKGSLYIEQGCFQSKSDSSKRKYRFYIGCCSSKHCYNRKDIGFNRCRHMFYRGHYMEHSFRFVRNSQSNKSSKLVDWLSYMKGIQGYKEQGQFSLDH